MPNEEVRAAVNKIVAQIISRAAAAVMGAALIYGGIWCFRVEWIMHSDLRQMGMESHYSGHYARGMPLPLLLGGGLIGIGIMFVLGAILPTAVFERCFEMMQK